MNSIFITIKFNLFLTHFDREMDARSFYGRKEKDRHTREIPSDSEDSDIDSNDSEEEWSAERGLSRTEK